LTAGASYCYDSRDVFLPDGTWIDVWSGKEYQGPYTYKVTHPLETSPIFVRKGSLAVLAPDMKNLNEKDWSELTLDAYPSASYSETTLYEDDTVTQAYKFGKYRTTKITAEAVNGKYTVNIGKAVGEFEGDKAFTTRKWNVRLHAFEELGAVKSVTVNGKRISGMSYFTRNSDASPFSFTGASAAQTASGETLTFTGNGTPLAYTNLVDGRLEMDFYDADFSPDFTVTGSSMVSGVTVTPESDHTRVTLSFTQPIWGHTVEYADGTTQVLLKKTPVRSDMFGRPLAGVTVLLDAGHGDHDNGAMGAAGYGAPVEKDVNLALTLAAKYRLEQMGASVQTTVPL